MRVLYQYYFHLLPSQLVSMEQTPEHWVDTKLLPERWSQALLWDVGQSRFLTRRGSRWVNALSPYKNPIPNGFEPQLRYFDNTHMFLVPTARYGHHNVQIGIFIYFASVARCLSIWNVHTFTRCRHFQNKRHMSGLE